MLESESLEWASQTLSEHANCVVYTFAASAVRVCIAAAEAGLNLKGTKFLVTGEPLTPQKKREIESRRRRGRSRSTEFRKRASLLRDATCPFAKRSLSPLQRHHRNHHPPITIPNSDLRLDSYLFTSMLYESPKLLLNVGMGDFGASDVTHCDCEFGQVGFERCLSSIRSYEKLTGEGVTFVDTDFVRIIEKELPDIFGGKSTDYQVVEEEDAKGLTHLRLLVSPRVGKVNEGEVVEKFMMLLKRGEASPESWAQSGSRCGGSQAWCESVVIFPFVQRAERSCPSSWENKVNQRMEYATK